MVRERVAKAGGVKDRDGVSAADPSPLRAPLKFLRPEGGPFPLAPRPSHILMSDEMDRLTAGGRMPPSGTLFL